MNAQDFFLDLEPVLKKHGIHSAYVCLMAGVGDDFECHSGLRMPTTLNRESALNQLYIMHKDSENVLGEAAKNLLAMGPKATPKDLSNLPSDDPEAEKVRQNVNAKMRGYDA